MAQTRTRRNAKRAVARTQARGGPHKGRGERKGLTTYGSASSESGGGKRGASPKMMSRLRSQGTAKFR